MIFSPVLLHAQTVSVGSFNNDLGPVQSAQPDSIVQITAEAEGLSQVDPTTLPLFASCYWTVYPGTGPVPMPCPPQDLSVPIYQIVDGYYLVDETGGAVSVNVSQTGTRAMTSSAVASAVDRQGNAIANLIEQVQATTANQQTLMLARAMGMDVPSPGGDGGGSYSPDGITNSYVAPDYGTNLWIAQTAVAAGYLNGIGTNTIADVLYEIQSRTNLVQTDWQSEGFIYGSEATNWTPLSVPQIGRINLFIRLRSWASSDSSSIPDWWEAQYGLANVDPNAQDSAGDGYTIYQKYQLGINPNTWVTPVAPGGLIVNFVPTANQANVQWQAAAGNITGYQVEKTYEGHGGNFDTVYSTSDFNVSASTLSLNDDVSSQTSDEFFPFQAFNDFYKVRAKYSNGQYSAWSGKTPLKTSFLSASLIYGANGQAFLTVSGVPAGTSKIRLFYFDNDAVSFGNTPINFSNDIPYSLFTNGLYALPDSLQPPAQDTYGYADWGYDVFAQTVDANSNATDYAWFYEGNGWKQPFYDGRVQLKQNLIFKLQAADADKPFRFYYSDSTAYYDYVQELYAPPTNYVESSFLHVTDMLYDTNYLNPYDYYAFHGSLIDPHYPFFENYLFYNFAASSANVDGNGLLDTGVGSWNDTDMKLSSTPVWKFQAPSGSWTNVAGLLTSSATSWLCSLPLDSSGFSVYSQLYENEVSDNNDGTFSLASGAKNLYGLPFLTVKIAGDAWPDGSISYNLTPGSTSPLEYFDAGPMFYAGTPQPQLQTVEYDFWSPVPVWNELLGRYIENWLPGSQYFSPTNQSQQFFVTVGSSVSVAGYAKMALQNGYSGVYTYLGQYFDKAYEVANNVATSTNTGVLSPYGDFFASEAGDAALVTMPDIDTGARGTGIVHCVSLAVDKNHDGTMDLSFSGADATSQASPMEFWANNNYDRWDNDDHFNTPEQDDQQIAFSPAAPITPTTDCNYSNLLASGYSYSYRAIPCTRDLEDFARLWVCGIDTNLIAKLPSGSTITLNWGDVGSPNSGNPTIDLFEAADADGGIGYLTNETTAAIQTNIYQCPYVGRLGPGGSIQLNAIQFVNGWAGNHFIWCGVSNGTGGLNLTIADGSGNVLAQSTAYIQIVDIKQMYERWTVGDNLSVPPTNTASLVTDNLPAGMSAFQYTPPTDPSTPYILLVHGYNMATWEKDRFAETAFKRLYWLGYQGRFGAFNWPTAEHFYEFGASELQAWKSAQGLLNKLNDLNAIYPGHVYLMAHSLGNVVAGEALLLATNQVVNTYVAMQGAVAAHAYDPTTPIYTPANDCGTPDVYAHYWTNGAPCYFNTTAGAGTYVNFFNPNDWALTNAWLLLFQNLKPILYPSYFYIPPGSYFKNYGVTELYFPGDRYEIFNGIIQSRSYALGMQVNVGGAFMTGTNYNQIELDIAPYNFGPQHIYHSGEFRSDSAQRWQFWNQVLIRMKLKSQ